MVLPILPILSILTVRDSSLCAFLMYAFWWHKPLLPEHPIILHDDKLAPLAAFMYSSSQMSGYVNPRRIKSKTIVKTFLAHLHLYWKTPEFENICLRDHRPSVSVRSSAAESDKDSISHEHIGNPHSQLGGNPALFFCDAPVSCTGEVQAMREKEKGTAFFERRPQVNDKRPRDENSSATDQNRWELMSHAVECYPSLLEGRVLLAHTIDESGADTGANDSARAGHAPSSCCVHLRPEQLVADHIQNWPGNDLLRDVEGLVVGMVLWFANLCYGAVHMAAWNEHFPSAAEMWLWRASATYISFCGGFWVTLNFAVARIPRLNGFWERWMDGEKTKLESLGLGLVVFVCGFSLILARMLVVVEAFVSIRALPVEAYRTPEWTNIFPHF